MKNMLGLIIAFVYAAIVYFIVQPPSTLPDAFLDATNFLFWWYIVTSAILGAIMVVIVLGMLGGGLILGLKGWGIAGGLLGFLGGGAISIFVAIVFVIRTGCLIGGVWLLHHSLAIASVGNVEWDMPKLVFGGILLLIGLLMNRSSGHSSSSSSTRN